MYGHSGNDNRVAMISKSYLTTTGITVQSLKSIGQYYHTPSFGNGFESLLVLTHKGTVC